MHTMHTTDKNSNNFDPSQCHQIEPLLLSKAYLLLVQELCNRAIAASNLMGKAKPDSLVNLTAAILNLVTAILLLIEKLTE